MIFSPLRVHPLLRPVALRYYNDMQDFIKTKLTHENRHKYIHLKFREECIEAFSKVVSLRELRKVYKGVLTPLLHEASALIESEYSDSALKYDVHLTVADDSKVEENGERTVSVRTLLRDKVERFVDCTDAMGELCRQRAPPRQLLALPPCPRMSCFPPPAQPGGLG